MSLKNLMVLLITIGTMMLVIVLDGSNVISVTTHQVGQNTTPAATPVPPVVTVVPTPSPVPTVDPTIGAGGKLPEVVPTVPPVPTPVATATPAPTVVVIPDPTNGQTQTQTGDLPTVVVYPTPTPTPVVDTTTDTGTGGADTGTGSTTVTTTTTADPAVGVEGSLEYIDDKKICVRAANPDNPTTRPFVSVYIGDQLMASARVAVNGLVLFNYAALIECYNGEAAADRPYSLAVTVRDPETKLERPVWSTSEFINPDYDLQRNEIEITNWTWRRTAGAQGTLTVWMKSTRPGRAAYRVTGPARGFAGFFWSRRVVPGFNGTGALARNEGSDVFSTQLKNFPSEGRFYPRLWTARGTSYQRAFRIPLSDDADYGKPQPVVPALPAETTVAADTTAASKLSAD